MPLMDLPLSNNNAEKISNIKYRLYLALLSDTLDDFPKAIGATIQANVLKAGRTHKFIDCKINSMLPNANPGESPLTGILTLTPIIEGISKQSLDWFYKNVGTRVIAIWERCADGQKFIGGSPCSGGLMIKFTNIGPVEGVDSISLSLEGGACAEPFLFYDGPIIREDPVVVSGATFALGASSQYLLSDNAAPTTLTDITNVTDADVGRIIELQGAGVTNPTAIETSANFILNSGLSFSAAVGRSISLFITKTGTGYAFHEVFRS